MVYPRYFYRALLYREKKLFRSSLYKLVAIFLIPIVASISFCVCRGAYPAWTVGNRTDDILYSKVYSEADFNLNTLDNIILNMAYYPKDDRLHSLIKCLEENILSDVKTNSVKEVVPVDSFDGLVDLYNEIVYYNTTGLDANEVFFGAGFDNVSSLTDYVYSLIMDPRATKARNIFVTSDQNSGPVYNGTICWADSVWFILNKCIFVESSDGEYKYDTVPFKMELTHFPYPVYTHDENRGTVINYYTPYLAFAISIMLIIPVLELETEFESGSEEMMALLGVPDLFRYFIRFFRILVPCLIISLFLPIICTTNFSRVALITYTDYWVLYLLFVLYYCSAISFVFALFAIIRSRYMTIILFALFLMFPAFTPGYADILKFISCSIPNIALQYAFQTMSAYDVRERQLNFAEIIAMDTPLYADFFNMLDIYIFLSFDAVMCFCIYFYIIKVHPNPFGKRHPWYFPFLNWVTEKYFCKFELDKKPKIKPEVEKVVLGSLESVRLYKVCHHSGSLFGIRQYIMKNLSVTFYANEITVLVSNDECLSTLFNLICGLYLPHAGILTVHNIFVKDDMNRVRNLVGYCPLQGMFMTRMTLQETLIFVGMIKGETENTAVVSSNQLLKIYEFKNKKDMHFEKLSLLEKKRFSIAFSRAGGTQVLLFYKPTDGFLEGAQDVWDLIMLEAATRTVIVASDCFEEAEYLADHVAFIDKAGLKCFGTPMFIKSTYKTGYTFNIQKDAHYQENYMSQLINRYLPNSFLQVNLKKEAHYLIPADNVKYFSQFFNVFENQQSIVGSKSLQITETSLERVYITLESTGAHEKVFTTAELESMLANREAHKIKLPKISQWKKLKILIGKTIMLNMRRYKKTTFVCLVPIITAVVGCFLINLIEPKYVTVELHDFNMTILDNVTVYYQIYEDASPDIEISMSAAIQESGATPIKSNNVEEDLLALASESLGTFRDKNIFALEWRKSEKRNGKEIIKLYASNTLDEGIAAGQITIFRFLFKQFIKNSSITFKSQLYPHIRRHHSIDLFVKNNLEIVMLNGWLIPLGLIIFLFSCGELPIRERIRGFRHQQTLAGVKFWTYWASFYLYDICLFTILTTAVSLILFFGESKLINHPYDMIYMVVSFYFGGSSLLLWLYFTSFYCNNMRNFLFFGTLLGLVSYVLAILVWALYMGIKDAFSSPLWIYNSIGHMSPIYLIVLFILRLQQQQALYGDCQVMSAFVDCNNYNVTGDNEYDCCDSGCLSGGCNIMYDLFKFPSIFYTILALVSQFALFTTLIAFKELNVFNRVYIAIFEKDIDLGYPINTEPEIDDEEKIVANEILSTSNVSKYNCLMHNMTKLRGTDIILRNIDLTVTSGQSIVICGATNSGKTLLLQIFAGLVPPSQGNVYMYKQVISRNRSFYMSNIAYCPEVSALSSSMSAYEVLAFFARLHGYSGLNLIKEIEFWLAFFNLEHVKNIFIQNIVKSDLRKLNLALSFMKNATVILLDDPILAVEDNDRESVFLLIENIKKSGQSIILTTNCQTVDLVSSICTKTAILYKGRLQCLAPTTDLVQRFGTGQKALFKLKTGKFRVTKVAINSLKDDITCRMTAELMYQSGDTLYYHIRDPLLKLSVLFTHLEQLKDEHDIIEDYNVSEISIYENFFNYLNYRERIDVASTKKASRIQRKQMESEAKSTSKKKKLVRKGQQRGASYSAVSQRPAMRTTCTIL